MPEVLADTAGHRLWRQVLIGICCNHKLLEGLQELDEVVTGYRSWRQGQGVVKARGRLVGAVASMLEALCPSLQCLPGPDTALSECDAWKACSDACTAGLLSKTPSHAQMVPSPAAAASGQH